LEPQLRQMEQETAGLSNPAVYRNDKFSLMIQTRKNKRKRGGSLGTVSHRNRIGEPPGCAMPIQVSVLKAEDV